MRTLLLLLPLLAGCAGAEAALYAIPALAAASYDATRTAEAADRRERAGALGEAYAKQDQLLKQSRATYAAALGECGVTVRRLDARRWVLNGCLRTLNCHVEGDSYACVVESCDAASVSAGLCLDGTPLR